MSFRLNIEDLSVWFGTRRILNCVDLQIPDRGVVTIMGPGGAGKSTLLRCMIGSLDEIGHARVAGTVEVRDGQIRLIHQQLALEPRTAFEVIADAIPDRDQCTRLEQRERILQLLEEFGAQDLAKHLHETMVLMARSEQRLVSIFAAILTDPAILAVDEPTAGLDDADSDHLLEVLSRISRRRAVVMVTHNQRHARKIADYACLLAGGRIVEFDIAAKFFERPDSDITRHYLRTGGCFVPSPDADEQTLDPEFAEGAPGFVAETTDTEVDTIEMKTIEFEAIETEVEVVEPPAKAAYRVPAPPRRTVGGRQFVPANSGPRGFHWLIEGSLAGCPQPGIVNDVEFDLAALERCGVTTVITLTETEIRGEAIAAAGFRQIFFPIVDMEAPAFADAFRICAEIEMRLSNDEVVVFHCKAGLGRTGTMLAAYLVYLGYPAQEALSQTRDAYDKWVQSQRQEEFLFSFSEWIESRSAQTA